MYYSFLKRSQILIYLLIHIFIRSALVMLAAQSITVLAALTVVGLLVLLLLMQLPAEPIIPTITE